MEQRSPRKASRAPTVWFGELAAELAGDREVARRVLRAFLHAWRDRITVDAAARLGAQLPGRIQGIYYEGWEAGRKARDPGDLASFLAHIRDEARLGGVTEAAHAVAAASNVLRRHVSSAELEEAVCELPPELRAALSE